MYFHIFLCVLVHSVTGDERIVGGHNVDVANFPYQAALYKLGTQDEGFHCGAVILSSKYILTAAHCALARPEAYEVLIGQSLIPRAYDQAWLKGKTYKIKSKLLHPNFDLSCGGLAKDRDSDIAILRIDGELDLEGTYAKAIKLSDKLISPGHEANVSGFGFTQRIPEEPEEVNGTEEVPPFVHLKAARVPIVSPDVCVKYYKKYPSLLHVTENMICAGSRNDNDRCFGDGGGPLVKDNELIGIVSYGAGCGSEVPGVYTSIYKNFKFVKEATSDAPEFEFCDY